MDQPLHGQIEADAADGRLAVEPEPVPIDNGSLRDSPDRVEPFGIEKSAAAVWAGHAGLVQDTGLKDWGYSLPANPGRLGLAGIYCERRKG
jgi:hypothetical protein